MGNLISKFSRMLDDKYNLNLNLICIENSILCDLNHSEGIVQRKLLYISIYCKTIQEYSHDHKFMTPNTKGHLPRVLIAKRFVAKKYFGY